MIKTGKGVQTLLLAYFDRVGMYGEALVVGAPGDASR